jgi:hypothetical protein
MIYGQQNIQFAQNMVLYWLIFTRQPTLQLNNNSLQITSLADQQ